MESEKFFTYALMGKPLEHCHELYDIVSNLLDSQVSSTEVTKNWFGKLRILPDNIRKVCDLLHLYDNETLPCYFDSSLAEWVASEEKSSKEWVENVKETVIKNGSMIECSGIETKVQNNQDEEPVSGNLVNKVSVTVSESLNNKDIFNCSPSKRAYFNDSLNKKEFSNEFEIINEYTINKSSHKLNTTDDIENNTFKNKECSRDLSQNELDLFNSRVTGKKNPQKLEKLEYKYLKSSRSNQMKAAYRYNLSQSEESLQKNPEWYNVLERPGRATDTPQLHSMIYQLSSILRRDYAKEPENIVQELSLLHKLYLLKTLYKRNNLNGKIVVVEVGAGNGCLTFLISGLLEVDVIGVDKEEVDQRYTVCGILSSGNLGTKIERITSDVRDVSPSSFCDKYIPKDAAVIIVSKHICGIGSDYSITLASKIKQERKVLAMLLTPCCLHKVISNMDEFWDMHKECKVGQALNIASENRPGGPKAVLSTVLACASWRTGGHRSTDCVAASCLREASAEALDDLIFGLRASRCASIFPGVLVGKYISRDVTPMNKFILASDFPYILYAFHRIQLSSWNHDKSIIPSPVTIAKTVLSYPIILCDNFIVLDKSQNMENKNNLSIVSNIKKFTNNNIVSSFKFQNNTVQSISNLENISNPEIITETSEQILLSNDVECISTLNSLTQQLQYLHQKLSNAGIKRVFRMREARPRSNFTAVKARNDKRLMRKALRLLRPRQAFEPEFSLIECD